MYSTPPSIDKLSEIYQDFYLKAQSHISTHINALSTRRSREESPTPSNASRSSSTLKISSKLASKTSKDTLNGTERAAPEQQMLTTQEISDRRRARRMLEYKRTALEEAVERRVCESVYSRIWRHKSTLDEVRDEKLRSRTAALALVGIDLQDLGIEFNTPGPDSETVGVNMESQVEDGISKAREGLLKMNEAKYPLGKLQHLAATHKSIVDLLTKLRQSSSSADEILPTLIYTLITTPPEGINIISNLQFTQRFRAAGKVDGEAAYCLTNLEAAITFLETVDLASLRSDEALEGPPKSSSRPATPHTETSSPWTPGTLTSADLSSPATTLATAVSTHADSVLAVHPLQSPSVTKNSPPASPSHQRRLSHLLQPPANAIGAASDAVRTTADQGFKNISNTLDNSFKLLFGRLKEHNIKSEGVDTEGTVILPRTLDDARKLVNPKPAVDEEGNFSGASSVVDQTDEQVESGLKGEDRLLGLIGGRNHMRESSVDSVQSTGSGKRVAFAGEVSATKNKAGSPNQPQAAGTSIPPSHAYAPNAAVESMRSLGNTLNPLNRLAGMNVMRGFGRSPMNTPPAPINSIGKIPEQEDAKEKNTPETNNLNVVKISPPIQQFMNASDSGELRIGEVGNLLADYQRLAGALKDLGAF